MFILFIMNRLYLIMTILFRRSHFSKHKYTEKMTKMSKKNTKKEPVVKKITIMTLFSKLIINFAESTPFYKGTL